MASASESSLPPKLPVFDGVNFGYWRYRMRAFLEYHGLWDVVGKEPALSDPYDFERDEKARKYIYAGLGSHMIRLSETAREAWYCLHEQYGEPEKEIPPEIIIEDRKTEHAQKCISLYQAAFAGDWEKAKDILDKDRAMIHTRITSNGETALHVATVKQHKAFVVNLLNRMGDHEWASEDNNRNSAFFYAAASGAVDIAEALLEKDKQSIHHRGQDLLLPIHMAALIGHKEMVAYLYSKNCLTSYSYKELTDFFLATISSDIFDTALKMIEDHQSLSYARGSDDMTALHIMARKPAALQSENQIPLDDVKQLQWLKGIPGFRRIFQRDRRADDSPRAVVESLWNLVVLSLPREELLDFLSKPSRMLFDAAASGNTEFLSIIIRSYPDPIWQVDSDGNTLFHIAIKHRRHNILNILHELGAFKYLVAMHKDKKTGDNVLHQVAKMPPPDRRQLAYGPVLQMQMELFWFEVVKGIVPASYQNERNKKKKLPEDIFIESHKNLQKEAQNWIKERAASFMLTATLIATVVFAAAFTVPGGNSDETGIPLLRKQWLFYVFVFSDALALFASAMSIVVVVNSNYSTPANLRTNAALKLEPVVFPLMVAIVSMIVTFITALLLIYDHKGSWMPILIIILGFVTLLMVLFIIIRRWIETFIFILQNMILFSTWKHELQRRNSSR